MSTTSARLAEGLASPGLGEKSRSAAEESSAPENRGPNEAGTSPSSPTALLWQDRTSKGRCVAACPREPVPATPPEQGEVVHNRRPAAIPRGVLLTLAGAAVVGAAALFLLRHSRPDSDILQLEPEETFRWSAQPIAFSPPARSWTREGHLEGGRHGVRFTRFEVPPSRIFVAEVYLLGQRDREKELQTLLANLDDMTPDDFRHAIALARAPADDPINLDEAEHARRANRYLDDAVGQFFGERRRDAHRSIEWARQELEAITYSVDDLLPRFRLTTDEFGDVDSVGVWDPHLEFVAGLRASRTDYWVGERGMLHQGSEIFTVVGRRAFVFGFLGREEDLPVFAQLLESVRFPAAGDTLASVRTGP